MPIKRILITHTLRKCFFGKGLEHYLRNRLRTMSQVVPKLKTANIRTHENSQKLWIVKFQDFVNILWNPDKPKSNFGKYCENNSWKYPFKRLLLIPKSFSAFGKFLLQKDIELRFFEKFHTVVNQVKLGKECFYITSNRVQIGKGMVFT